MLTVAYFAKDSLHNELFSKVLKAVEDRELVLHDSALSPNEWTLIEHGTGFTFVNVFPCDGIGSVQIDSEDHDEGKFEMQILDETVYSFEEVQTVLQQTLDKVGVDADKKVRSGYKPMMRYIKFDKDMNLHNQYIELWGDRDDPSNTAFPLIASREDIKNFIINTEDEEYMENLNDEDYLNNKDYEFWSGYNEFCVEPDGKFSWDMIGECSYYEDEYRNEGQYYFEIDNIENHFHDLINTILLGQQIIL